MKNTEETPLGWRPSLLGWRPFLLLGWRSLLLGWRPLLATPLRSWRLGTPCYTAQECPWRNELLLFWVGYSKKATATEVALLGLNHSRMVEDFPLWFLFLLVLHTFVLYLCSFFRWRLNQFAKRLTVADPILRGRDERPTSWMGREGACWRPNRACFIKV